MFQLYLPLVLLLGACETRANKPTKPSSLLYANLGDNVTLQCFHPSTVNHLSWYKQTAQQTPQLLSHCYKGPSYKFCDKFEVNTRFSVETGVGYHHLIISKVQLSDSAMYFCGTTVVTCTEFVNGIFLVLKETTSRSFLQHTALESVHLGDSVTLKCTVYIKNCDAEHSVYWVRHDSEDFRVETVNINRDRTSQCERSFEKESCIYRLPKSNVSLSDAGTYYCAVASCGTIVFGNHTTLKVSDGHLDGLPVCIASQYTQAIVYCLCAVLVVSFVLISVLTLIIHKMRVKRVHLLCREQCHQLSSHANTDHQDEESDRLQYAAVSFNQKAKARRQKSTETEVIYSKLRRPNLD